MNPLGFYANRLGVDIHVITANTPPIRNLDLSVRQAHMGVDKIVAAPVASGLSCLAAEERELGVALVELGAGVTNVAVFARGMLVGLSSIPMGARSEEHTSELQSLMRISYAVLCLKKKSNNKIVQTKRLKHAIKR